MKLIEAPQYSIWWLPDGKLFSKLQNTVNILGREFDACKYGAETFVPHISLVPDIIPGCSLSGNLEDLVAKLGEFSAKLDRAVIFELTEITKGDSFFQCVFARAKLNALMFTTVKKARQLCRPDLIDAPFIPHLSLLYGDFSQGVRDLAVIRAHELTRLPQTFIGNKMSLWTSGVPAKDYQMVVEFKVGGK